MSDELKSSLDGSSATPHTPSNAEPFKGESTASTPNQNIHPQSQSPFLQSTKFIVGMVGILVFCMLIFLGLTYWIFTSIRNSNTSSTNSSSNTSQTISQNSSATSAVNANTDIVKFASEAEFKTYLSKLSNTTSEGDQFLSDKQVNTTSPNSPSSTSGSGTTTPRYSTTNNQVNGVDEPDIVKTDGKNIYLSSEYSYGYYTGVASKTDVYRPYGVVDTPTRIINTLPVDKIAELSKISDNGKLLLSSNILVINVNNQNLVAYDITDSKNPTKIWKMDLGSNEYISSLRTIDGKIYLISNNSLSTTSPCVYDLYKTTSFVGESSNSPIQFRCTDLYYPQNFKNLSQAVNVAKLDIKTGSIITKNSFLAQSSWGDISYVSVANSYIAYRNEPDQLKMILDFIDTDGKDIFPSSIISRFRYLKGLDISSNSINSEIYNTIYAYTNTLNSDDALKFKNNIQNLVTNYIQKNQRVLSSSKIIKISNDTLQVTGDAVIPGNPLNQYSLDEYKGNLRIATTTSSNFYIANYGSNAVTTLNDIYILDKDMNQIGKILDLGVGERIYSSRFVNDLGYLVTFRQTDPFYVLDLSDPRNPKKTGELKIPGYSSYLHPLSDKFILGIGQDGGNLKVSLFDVSDKSNPKESDKFTLNDYGSSIQYDPHAFLLDSDKKLFFVPGYSGAYIFSYTDDGKLSLAKAVSGSGIARAVFVNSNLYTISSTQIKVISEDTFKELGKIDF